MKSRSIPFRAVVGTLPGMAGLERRTNNSPVRAKVNPLALVVVGVLAIAFTWWFVTKLIGVLFFWVKAGLVVGVVAGAVILVQKVTKRK